VISPTLWGHGVKVQRDFWKIIGTIFGKSSSEGKKPQGNLRTCGFYTFPARGLSDFSLSFGSRCSASTRWASADLRRNVGEKCDSHSVVFSDRTSHPQNPPEEPSHDYHERELERESTGSTARRRTDEWWRDSSSPLMSGDRCQGSCSRTHFCRHVLHQYLHD
jgi:hypothetical protein